jgi:formylglycine-generating enzyme required for sulfatase activity
MARKMFISYRRDDSAGHAGRVHDHLEREFGRDLLFMDVDAIPLGANFVKVLDEEIAACDVLLAIIGPGWLDARDENGKRRLENPNDFVRIEIANALKRGISVIPILLEGTRVPKAEQLPEDLKELGLHQGLDVRHASFANDMGRLVTMLQGVQSRSQQRPAEPALFDRYRAEGRIKVDAAIVHGAPDGWFLPGNGKVEWFQDSEHGPEMVVVPAGSFVMGSPESELERSEAEGPQHPVTIATSFAVGRHPIKRGEFAAFVKDTGHEIRDEALWRDPGFPQDDNHPVVCVSCEDAKAFTAWLSARSGQDYRLLTEAEWEYVARAGTATPFWWGSTISPQQANYNGSYLYGNGGAEGEYREQTVAVANFPANPWGLFQVHGNVLEWCEDVWHDNYDGAPSNGSAWLEGGNAYSHVVRGGSWLSFPQDIRSAFRAKASAILRIDNLGFRVRRTPNS